MEYPQITQITQISALGRIAVGYLKKSSRRRGGLVRVRRAVPSQARLHITVLVEGRGTHVCGPGAVQPSTESA